MLLAVIRIYKDMADIFHVGANNSHHYPNTPIPHGPVHPTSGCSWNGAGHACLDNINGSIVGGATAGGIIGGATGGGILPGIAIGGVTGGVEHCVSNLTNYFSGC